MEVYVVSINLFGSSSHFSWYWNTTNSPWKLLLCHLLHSLTEWGRESPLHFPKISGLIGEKTLSSETQGWIQRLWGTSETIVQPLPVLCIVYISDAHHKTVCRDLSQCPSQRTAVNSANAMLCPKFCPQTCLWTALNTMSEHLKMPPGSIGPWGSNCLACMDAANRLISSTLKVYFDSFCLHCVHISGFLY